MMRSTDSRLKIVRASRPEAAVSTAWPAWVSIARTRSSTSGSSSTARMRKGSTTGTNTVVRLSSPVTGGKDSVNVVPTPSRLWSVIVPP